MREDDLHELIPPPTPREAPTVTMTRGAPPEIKPGKSEHQQSSREQSSLERLQSASSESVLEDAAAQSGTISGSGTIV